MMIWIFRLIGTVLAILLFVRAKKAAVNVYWGWRSVFLGGKRWIDWGEVVAFVISAVGGLVLLASIP